MLPKQVQVYPLCDISLLGHVKFKLGREKLQLFEWLHVLFQLDNLQKIFAVIIFRRIRGFEGKGSHVKLDDNFVLFNLNEWLILTTLFLFDVILGLQNIINLRSLSLDHIPSNELQLIGYFGAIVLEVKKTIRSF